MDPSHAFDSNGEGLMNTTIAGKKTKRGFDQFTFTDQAPSKENISGSSKAKSTKPNKKWLWIPPWGSFGVQRMKDRRLGRSPIGASRRTNIKGDYKKSSS